jgi:hypothetical protein
VIQSPTPTSRQSEIQNLLVNENYQGAIDATINLYGIETYAPIKFDPNSAGSVTHVEDGLSEIGTEAMTTVEKLVASVAHEAEHQDQLFNSRWYTNEDGIVLNEIEAYDNVINSADELELSPSTITWLEKKREVYLFLLRPDFNLRRKNPGSGDKNRIYMCDACPVAPRPAQ